MPTVEMTPPTLTNYGAGYRPNVNCLDSHMTPKQVK